jgi:hypothetical protein
MELIAQHFVRNKMILVDIISVTGVLVQKFVTRIGLELTAQYFVKKGMIQKDITFVTKH